MDCPGPWISPPMPGLPDRRSDRPGVTAVNRKSSPHRTELRRKHCRSGVHLTISRVVPILKTSPRTPAATHRTLLSSTTWPRELLKRPTYHCRHPQPTRDIPLTSSVSCWRVWSPYHPRAIANTHSQRMMFPLQPLFLAGAPGHPTTRFRRITIHCGPGTTHADICTPRTHPGHTQNDPAGPDVTLSRPSHAWTRS